MTVTVGRIEYIVGADGRVLTKESRDVARAAGKRGGKTYSDEFTKELRSRWGSASGFAATLSKEDQKVLKQFQKTGVLSSKKFADAFEKNLVPAYQAVGKRLVKNFESLKFDTRNGLMPELERIFGKSEDVEKSMRSVKDVLDEIDAVSRMGILDSKSFDIGAVNKMRTALSEVMDAGNWELLTDSQIRLREELWEQSLALEAQESQLKERARLMEANRKSGTQLVEIAEVLSTRTAEETAEIQHQSDLLKGRLTTERMVAAVVGQHSRDLREQAALYTKELEDQERLHRENADHVRITYNTFERLRQNPLSWITNVADTMRDMARIDPFGNLRRDDLDLILSSTREELFSIRTEAQRSRPAFIALGGAMQSAFSPLFGFWQNLDRDVRMVIQLVASASGEIASLGSALGAGLVGAGAVASSAIGGIAAGVTALVVLNRDLEDLPPNLREAAREVQLVGNEFGHLATTITGGFVRGANDAFLQLGETLRGLSPALADFGRVSGRVFDDFTESTAEGTEAFDEMIALLENGTDLFPDLAEMAGTWGLALIRALNQATPLAEDLVGWLDKLGNRFDAFTRGPGFADWVGDAQVVFAGLGQMLDEVGAALNELSNPQNAANLAELFINVGRLVGPLGELLNVLSALDPLGILAEILADMAEVMAELTPILLPLASGLREVAMAASPGLAVALMAVVGALTAMRASNALGGLAENLAQSKGMLSQFSGTASKASGSIAAFAGKLGVVGITLGAIVGGASLIKQADRAIRDLDNTMRENVETGASFAEVYETANTSILGVTPGMDHLSEALDRLDGKTGFLNDTWSTWTSGMGQTGVQLQALQTALDEVDEPLAEMARSSLPDAVKQFTAYGKELDASRGDMLNMINEMPAFKQALIDQARELGVNATDANLLAIALGEIKPVETKDSVRNLEELSSTALLTRDDVNALADSITNFGDRQIDTIEASIAFEDSLADLYESLQANGAALDMSTDAGRRNTESLLGVVQAANDAASATLNQTNSVDQANSVLATQKQRLIDTIQQMDAAGYEAGLYTDIINLIPDDVETVANMEDTQASADAAALRDQYYRDIGSNWTARAYLDISSAEQDLNAWLKIKPNKYVSVVYDLPDAFNVYTGLKRATGGAIRGPGTGTSDTAGLYALSNGEHVLTAKEVRAMGGQAAVYQFRRSLGGGGSSGAGGGGMATGGAVTTTTAPVGASRSVSISPGAITIQGALDPERTAVTLLNRLAERIAG